MSERQRGVVAVQRAWLLTLGCMALLAGCSREASDWRSTQGTDTIEAYERFVAQYPQSEFAAQARERGRQLAEQRDWQTATGADTAEAYQRFLSQHPDGKWAQEARVRIENFHVLEAPPAAAPVSAGAVPAPAAPAPAAPAPARPPPAVQSALQHRVQLGAFSSEAKAREAWQAAADRFAALRPLTPQVTTAERGDARLYRLQTALRSEPEARELCRTLEAGGHACLYVPPP